MGVAAMRRDLPRLDPARLPQKLRATLCGMLSRILTLLGLLLGSAFAQSTTTPAAGKFPALNLQVIVGTQQRREAGYSYRKTMSIAPKLTLAGASRLTPIPAAEAEMMIITMDTRAKYTAKKEVYQVHAKQTLPIPAAPNGEPRQFTFEESLVSYDSYRDTSNVGGEVYKYYVFALRDPETKAVIDFKTNHPGLATAAKTQPAKRDEVLGLAKGKQLPSGF